MKFLRLHIHSGFSRCILSGIAVNTLRLFNPVYESLRTVVYALYDSFFFAIKSFTGVSAYSTRKNNKLTRSKKKEEKSK